MQTMTVMTTLSWSNMTRTTTTLAATTTTTNRTSQLLHQQSKWATLSWRTSHQWTHSKPLMLLQARVELVPSWKLQCLDLLEVRSNLKCRPINELVSPKWELTTSKQFEIESYVIIIGCFAVMWSSSAAFRSCDHHRLLFPKTWHYHSLHT